VDGASVSAVRLTLRLSWTDQVLKIHAEGLGSPIAEGEYSMGPISTRLLVKHKGRFGPVGFQSDLDLMCQAKKETTRSEGYRSEVTVLKVTGRS
jgi:hypothetical protein